RDAANDGKKVRAIVMTMDEFERLLARSGAETDQWPVSGRGRALALLETSAAARALLKDARSVDALLRDYEADKAPPGLNDAILARVNAEIMRQSREASLSKSGSGLWSAAFW